MYFGVILQSAYMNHQLKVLFIVLLSFDISASAQQVSKPFPQLVSYFKGSIKPNHTSQHQLDGLTLNFYRQWQKRYIKAACKPGRYFVWFERKGDIQSVSEGQGYGMMITVLMAGGDVLVENIC